MSISIYYSATRKTPLTTVERGLLDELTNALNQSFPYKNEAETLNFYDEPSHGVILEGSTKLTLENEVILMESIEYWLDAISQLTLLLPSTEWSVSIEDNPASWIDNYWEM